ncbi:lasso peptide biosynthesis B2 protein [Salmonella enterica subsp. enterica serovar Urbana]|nr:lasso peptide biosynthesis B2 protein [Salmonella enterica subsp. enterica serovar Urbana]
MQWTDVMLITPDTLRIACFNKDLVVLDLLLDEYTILENAADSFLTFKIPDPEVEAFLNDEKNCHYLQKGIPNEPESFLDVRWMKPPVKITHSPALSRISALRTMLYCRKSLRRGGLMAVKRRFSEKQTTGYATKITPEVNAKIEDEMAALNSIFDFIAHENPCLVYSYALKQRLLSRKIFATLVIGVRTQPFYSHAWVEVENTVVSDDPDLRKKTSVILEC